MDSSSVKQVIAKQAMPLMGFTNLATRTGATKSPHIKPV